MNNMCKSLDAQEIAEQNKARENLRLPQKMTPCQKDFESLGFVFKSIPGDQVLAHATLPVGWSIESHENNSCYAFIVDDKGRRRGISYYDDNALGRCGQLSLLRRFCINSKSQNPLVEVEGPFTVFVQDSINDSVLFTAGKCDVLYTWKYNALVQKAKTYLQTRYPCWENPLEYWD